MERDGAGPGGAAGVRGQRLPGCRGDRGRATRVPGPRLSAPRLSSRPLLGLGTALGSGDERAYSGQREAGRLG